MEINEVAEQIAEFEKKEEKQDIFRRKVALLISVLALLLAVTALGGNKTTKELLGASIEASDVWNFYQAKTIRQTAYLLAAEEGDSWLSSTALPDPAKQALAERVKQYRDTVARYESEANGTGKKELKEKAEAIEHRRAEAEHREHGFSLAEAMLQIAIVLASAAVASGARLLVNLAAGLGAIGGLLSINAFLLLVTLPF